jgi:hypothetical protein
MSLLQAADLHQSLAIGLLQQRGLRLAYHCRLCEFQDRELVLWGWRGDEMNGRPPASFRR